MSTHVDHPRFACQQRGFTLVELMVTVGIALFLLGGLVTIVQNVRQANLNQTVLAQLQDEERFAFTVITDAIQSAGYFADPINATTGTFGLSPNPAPTQGFQAGWVFAGSHVTGVADNVAQDTIATRFQTAPNYGPILCNGTDTSNPALGPQTWQVEFRIDPINHWLLCTVNNILPAVQLVGGVQAMAIYYGVKRDLTVADYNVDTYLTWDQMNAGSQQDYTSISAIRVVLTFTNPLFPQANQPQTITVERVIANMARAGVNQ
jgi:type IV pilus assembly protein PilW